MHKVRFEGLDLSPNKMGCLKDFASNPSSILLLQGTKGNGKTWSSLAVCEYFTRTNFSCIFISQEDMQAKWLETFKTPGLNTFIDKIIKCRLLVIDDFGTGNIPPGFMKVFFQIIDKRLQWEDRGTIITTNLTNEAISQFCGEALNDRISTGIRLEFYEPSRR